MEIQGPNNVSGPTRIDAVRPSPAEAGEPAAESAPAADRVEISEEAKWLEKLHEVPPIREERIAEIRREIEAGTYETAERIEKAADRLLEELEG